MVVAAWSETETARLGEALRSGGARGLAAALPRSFRIYATAAGVAGLGTIALLPVIYVTLGARFTGALWLIPALLVCSVIDVFYLPSNTVLSLTSRTRELPPITFASGLFGLGMSAIFIPLFGTWGVILARGITVGFRSALTTWRAYAALRDRGAPSEAGSTS
jgi:O-antigen/teichoic acid export membrane protein